MSRKRTTPPPAMTGQEAATRRYQAFWGDAPPREPRTCRNSQSRYYPWVLHCPSSGCKDRCALEAELGVES